MVVGKEFDKVVNKVREVAARVLPSLKIRSGRGTESIGERVVGTNWVC